MLIKMLNEGCIRYRIECGAYPPMEPFSDSRCLHYYLGKEIRIPEGKNHEGIFLRSRTLPPIIQFRAYMLDLPKGNEDVNPLNSRPVPVIDAWGRKVHYGPYPGKHNHMSIDIWSLGEDEKDPADDITNWNKE
jgi:hypothetical protein